MADRKDKSCKYYPGKKFTDNPIFRHASMDVKDLQENSRLITRVTLGWTMMKKCTGLKILGRTEETIRRGSLGHAVGKLGKRILARGEDMLPKAERNNYSVIVSDYVKHFENHNLNCV